MRENEPTLGVGGSVAILLSRLSCAPADHSILSASLIINSAISPAEHLCLVRVHVYVRVYCICTVPDTGIVS